MEDTERQHQDARSEYTEDNENNNKTNTNLPYHAPHAVTWTVTVVDIVNEVGG